MASLFLVSVSEVFSYLLYILLAVLVLLVMITVHEFGHFITGKIFGFRIEEFSIGFGPKIFGREKENGEKFSIRALPLGGFCAFYGEDEKSDDPGAFDNKKPWQRLIVLLSGAFMNYILAIIVIALMFGIYGHTAIMAYDVDEVKQSTNGVEYCLQDRDVLLKAEGKDIYLPTDLMVALKDKKQGDVVELSILRARKVQKINFKLLADADFSNVEDTEKLANCLGMTITYDNDEISDMGFRTTGVKLGFFKTIGKSFEYSFKLAGTIFTVIRQLFVGALNLSSVGGTITTISVTADAIKIGGLWSLFNITAFIGVNLAVFNLIPFPALDGSRAVFVIIEWIFKKPVNKKVESTIHTIGFILLLTFALFVDLQQCL